MKKRTLIIDVCIVSPIAQWLLDLFAGHWRVSDFEQVPVASFWKEPVLSTWATVSETVFAGRTVIVDDNNGRCSTADPSVSDVTALVNDNMELSEIWFALRRWAELVEGLMVCELLLEPRDWSWFRVRDEDPVLLSSCSLEEWRGLGLAELVEGSLSREAWAASCNSIRRSTTREAPRMMTEGSRGRRARCTVTISRGPTGVKGWVSWYCMIGARGFLVTRKAEEGERKLRRCTLEP